MMKPSSAALRNWRGRNFEGAGEAAPKNEDEAGYSEAESCGEKRRDDADDLADSEERSTPEDVNGCVGQESAHR